MLCFYGILSVLDKLFNLPEKANIQNSAVYKKLMGIVIIEPMTINPNNKFYPFSNQNYNDIVTLLNAKGNRRKVNPGEAIINEGELCNFFFYIEYGCFRAYRYIDEEEVTIGFSFKGDLDTCPYSFINDLPSIDVIEALTYSSVLVIRKSYLSELEKVNPLVTKFVNFMLSSYIETLICRALEFKTLNAEEIYLKMLRLQPQELANIPLKHLASYLGITPERLSRIRRKHPKLI